MARKRSGRGQATVPNILLSFVLVKTLLVLFAVVVVHGSVQCLAYRYNFIFYINSQVQNANAFFYVLVGSTPSSIYA